MSSPATEWKAKFPDGIGTIRAVWAVPREVVERYFSDHFPNIEVEIRERS